MDRVGKSTVCDTNSMGSLQQREEGKLKTLRSVDVWFTFVHLPGRENSYQNIGQYKMQTADCRLQTADRVQNAD